MTAFYVAAFWVCWWKGEAEGRFHSGALICLYCCVWITYEEENMTLRILYILILFLKCYIFVTAVVIATFKFGIRLV